MDFFCSKRGVFSPFSKGIFILFSYIFYGKINIAYYQIYNALIFCVLKFHKITIFASY